MPDAIADVQTKAIEWARKRAMPAGVAQWKALVMKMAKRWALDRRRAAKVRRKYDAGLCEDPDAYMRPTLRWEHRDPVDTKRYIAVLKGMFDAGRMPERGEEILQDAADEVAARQTAAELGIREDAVWSRMSRMRARFRARLATLGLLTLVMLLLLSSVLAPVGGVGAPAPEAEPTEEVAPAPVEPAPDAGEAGLPENRPGP
jgi:DNA-directed RNA polymerase specialized sigma24 family protein